MIVMDRSDFWNCNATLDHRSCEFQEATVSVLCAAAGSLPPGSTIQIGDVEGVSVIDSSISGSQLTVELRITNRTVPGELGVDLQLSGDGIDYRLPNIAVASLTTGPQLGFASDSFDFGEVGFGLGKTDVVGYGNFCSFDVGFRLRLSNGSAGFRFLPPTIRDGELGASQIADVVINFIPPIVGLAEDDVVLQFFVDGVTVHNATLRLTGKGVEL